MENILLKRLKKVLFAVAIVASFVSVAPKNVEAAKKVTMDRTKVTCVAKERFTLKVKNAGNKKIEWSSSKPSVATVSRKGNVVTKKAGKATIKATVNKKTVTCKVTVKKNASKPWCLYSKKTIRVGESFLLIEGSCTNYEMAFTFNERIASVTPEGRVTGTGIGTTKILVNRGVDKNGKYRDYYCTVNVVAGSAPKCSHNWMDVAKYNSNGKDTGAAYKIKNYHSEIYEECIQCGYRCIEEDIEDHFVSTGYTHGGSMVAGSSDPCTFYKWLSWSGSRGGQYCSKCGLSK